MSLTSLRTSATANELWNLTPPFPAATYTGRSLAWQPAVAIPYILKIVGADVVAMT